MRGKPGRREPKTPGDPLNPRVEDITDRGLDVSVSNDPAFLGALEELADGAGARSGSATLRVEAFPERVEVSGTVHAQLPQTCARCVEPFTLTLQRSFRQVLLRTGEHAAVPDDEEERELLAEELDRSELVGDTLDLRAVLREELLLSMPSKLLCAPECRGLCSGCGLDLNKTACICPPAIDHRWDALRALKLDH